MADVWTAGRVGRAESGEEEVKRGKREVLTGLEVGVGRRETEGEGK